MDEEKPSVLTRLQHAWNAFNNKDPGFYPTSGVGEYVAGSLTSYQPGRRRRSFGVDSTIVVSVYNRLAVDTAMVTIEHCRVDENDAYMESIPSGLNHVLTVEANVDQTSREFLFDLVMSMFDEGVVAAVPVDTDIDIRTDNVFDIKTMRVGKIVSWMPQHVSVELYNDQNGRFQQVTLPKKSIAIIRNPFYDVMNQPMSTLRRLTRKLALLDDIDEQSGSGKLDLILQMPYPIRRESQRQQAEKRRKQMEEQLANSKFGIAYTDGTEKVVQLNRSVENNLMSQIEYLTSMLYGQLGLTAEIMNGTATESTMLNYYNRTISAIVNAITDEFSRKFLTKTARTRGQAIKSHREPFSLTTTDQLAELADKLTRNAILSPNEIRSVIGYKPVADERADELRNRNLNASDEELANPVLTDAGGEEADDGYEDPYAYEY